MQKWKKLKKTSFFISYNFILKLKEGKNAVHLTEAGIANVPVVYLTNEIKCGFMEKFASSASHTSLFYSSYIRKS